MPLRSNFPIRRYNSVCLQRVRPCLFLVVRKYSGLIHCLLQHSDKFCNICANFCQLFVLIWPQKGTKRTKSKTRNIDISLDFLIEEPYNMAINMVREVNQMAKLVKKTIELNQDYIDRARLIFAVRTEKEAVNKALEMAIIDDDIIMAHELIGGSGDVIDEAFK